MRSADRARRPADPADRAKGDLIGEDRRVYDCVLAAVMAHRLPPGTKLVESALCELLGVPRTVVRMGLLRLAHDRIVELRPNRGAVVAQPTVAEAREVYAARCAIEGAVAEMLAGRLPAARARELRRIVDRGTEAFDRGDAAAWIREAGDFHVRLAEATRNSILTGFVTELVTRSNLITALYLRPGRTVFAREARLALVELLQDEAADSAARAKSAMRAMLESIADKLSRPTETAARVDLRTALRTP